MKVALEGPREIRSFAFNRNGEHAMFWCCFEVGSYRHELRFTYGPVGPPEIVCLLKRVCG